MKSIAVNRKCLEHDFKNNIENGHLRLHNFIFRGDHLVSSFIEHEFLKTCL